MFPFRLPETELQGIRILRSPHAQQAQASQEAATAENRRAPGAAALATFHLNMSNSTMATSVSHINTHSYRAMDEEQQYIQC